MGTRGIIAVKTEAGPFVGFFDRSRVRRLEDRQAGVLAPDQDGPQMSDAVAGQLTEASHGCRQLGGRHRRHVPLDEVERHEHLHEAGT